MNAVNANSFRFDANIVLDGKMNINQTAHVQLVLNKDENGAVQGADVHATAEIEGRTLSIKVLGNKDLYSVWRYEAETELQMILIPS